MKNLIKKLIVLTLLAIVLALLWIIGILFMKKVPESVIFIFIILITATLIFGYVNYLVLEQPVRKALGMPERIDWTEEPDDKERKRR